MKKLCPLCKKEVKKRELSATKDMYYVCSTCNWTTLITKHKPKKVTNVSVDNSGSSEDTGGD